MSEFTLAKTEKVFEEWAWVMDPPPWIAVKLDEGILKDIYRIKVEALAQVTGLEVQAKQIEQDMYHRIAEILR